MLNAEALLAFVFVAGGLFALQKIRKAEKHTSNARLRRN
jgi:hypothetical protein